MGQLNGASGTLCSRSALIGAAKFGFLGNTGLVMRRYDDSTDEKIAVGDTVRFKGGGSAMTVEAIEDDEAICVFSLGGKQRLKLDCP